MNETVKKILAGLEDEIHPFDLMKATTFILISSAHFIKADKEMLKEDFNLAVDATWDFLENAKKDVTDSDE